MGSTRKRRTKKYKPLVLHCHFLGDEEAKAKLLLLKWKQDDARAEAAQAALADDVVEATAGVEAAQPPSCAGAAGGSGAETKKATSQGGS